MFYTFTHFFFRYIFTPISHVVSSTFWLSFVLGVSFIFHRLCWLTFLVSFSWTFPHHFTGSFIEVFPAPSLSFPSLVYLHFSDLCIDFLVDFCRWVYPLFSSAFHWLLCSLFHVLFITIFTATLFGGFRDHVEWCVLWFSYHFSSSFSFTCFFVFFL